MEMTQELLVAALDALMDQSHTKARAMREAARDCTPYGEAQVGFMEVADLHSQRLHEAAELAKLIRAHGVSELRIYK